jgi:hypothetical protein
MKRREPLAGNPAAILPGIVTEQDRAIVTRREAGETRKAICEAFGVTVGRVYHAEYACQCDARGRELLANRPDSIEGLSWIGELDGNASHRLRYHHYHNEGGTLEGLSDVAALGRRYVSRIKGIGPKSLASIDRALGLLGIAWSPIEQMPKPKPRQQEQERGQWDSDAQYWNSIVRRVAEIERAVGAGFLRDNPGQDSMQGVSYRLAFLTGYLESKTARDGRHTSNMRDVTPKPEQDDGEYETAGNLICLPGVKLASIRRDSDDPGPSAA